MSVLLCLLLPVQLDPELSRLPLRDQSTVILALFVRRICFLAHERRAVYAGYAAHNEGMGGGILAKYTIGLMKIISSDGKYRALLSVSSAKPW